MKFQIIDLNRIEELEKNSIPSTNRATRSVRRQQKKDEIESSMGGGSQKSQPNVQKQLDFKQISQENSNSQIETRAMKRAHSR